MGCLTVKLAVDIFRVGLAENVHRRFYKERRFDRVRGKSASARRRGSVWSVSRHPHSPAEPSAAVTEADVECCRSHY
jgi:hypothetical protein